MATLRPAILLGKSEFERARLSTCDKRATKRLDWSAAPLTSLIGQLEPL